MYNLGYLEEVKDVLVELENNGISECKDKELMEGYKDLKQAMREDLDKGAQ